MKGGKQMVVQTPEGYIPVLSDYDVIDTIRKNVSDDVANFVDTRLHELNEENRYEELKFNSDFTALETSLDEYGSALNDIWLIAEELSNKVKDSKRLDRQEILKKVEAILEITRQF
jgi:hypothetical protein